MVGFGLSPNRLDVHEFPYVWIGQDVVASLHTHRTKSEAFRKVHHVAECYIVQPAPRQPSQEPPAIHGSGNPGGYLGYHAFAELRQSLHRVPQGLLPGVSELVQVHSNLSVAHFDAGPQCPLEGTHRSADDGRLAQLRDIFLDEAADVQTRLDALRECKRICCPNE